MSTLLDYPAVPGAAVACTAAAEAMREQSEAMCALLEEAQEVTRMGGGVRLGFAAGTERRARLVAWIEQERRCCAFLGYRLEEADGVLALEISGGGEAEAWLRTVTARSRES